MKSIIVIALYQILLCRSQESAEEHWNYSEQNKWYEVAKSCSGKNQSPISLWDSNKKTKMAPFKFINYSDQHLPRTVTLENNGRSIICSFTGVTPKVSGGGLEDTYVLSALHFHWGVNNYQGAEHIVNNEQAAMELHMVHYNSKFANLTRAIASGERNAVAVLAVLHRIDNSCSNPSIDKIASRLLYVMYKGQRTPVKPFSFRKLIPDSTSYFFRYSGSLTTPHCDEVVAWTVFRDPGFITSAQMKGFRKTYSTGENEQSSKTIANNFRRIQPLNGRTVYQGVETHPNEYPYY